MEIVGHMASHPNRAYFSDLFRLGCFRSGIEVGVASGRFSEHFLVSNKDVPMIWSMVEPFPNDELRKLFNISDGGVANFQMGKWAKKGVGVSAHKSFAVKFSTDKVLLDGLADGETDFIYLDGSHSYKNVKRELPNFYQKLKPCGVLAGHDYCNYGEKTLDCVGCRFVPRCGKYTEYGMRQGKPNEIAQNQAGVVQAVQEWLVEEQPELRVRYTKEDFTRQSLAQDGFDYDLVITNTRNPSWYVVKPC